MRSKEIHKRASVQLTTNTGAKLKITGLTDDDIERIAELMGQIASRQEDEAS